MLLCPAYDTHYQINGCGNTFVLGLELRDLYLLLVALILMCMSLLPKVLDRFCGSIFVGNTIEIPLFRVILIVGGDGDPPPFSELAGGEQSSNCITG